MTAPHPEPPEVFPSPKERLQPVYQVPPGPVKRDQRVIYQLEDTGHPLIRMRVTVRLSGDPQDETVLYRVDAYSRVSGELLGSAETTAPHGSAEAYAALARQFQTVPFRRVLHELRDQLAERYGDAVPEAAIQR